MDRKREIKRGRKVKTINFKRIFIFFFIEIYPFESTQTLQS